VTEPDPSPPGEPKAAPPDPTPDEPGAQEMSADPEPARSAAAEPTGDAVFDAMWKRVEETWDDDKIHNAILEYSVSNERLPDLAGHYRVLSDDPARAERAKKRLDAIILAATSLMMSMRTPTTTKVPLSITLSVAGLFFSAVVFVWYAMMHR